MSDVFEGPGWWLASDGRWYSPDDHVDPNYRAQFALAAPPVVPQPNFPQVATVAPTSTNVEEETATVTNLHHRMESVNGDATRLANESTVASPLVSVAQTDETVSNPTVSDGWTPLLDESEVAPTPEVHGPHDQTAPINGAPTANAPDETEHKIETPTVDAHDTESISAMPKATTINVSAQEAKEALLTETITHTEIEPTSDNEAPQSAPLLQVANPSAGISAPLVADPMGGETSTALVPVAGDVVGFYREVRVRDWILAILVFSAGVALIVGTFLAWTVTGDVEVNGWERLSGILTIASGVVGSTAAGPLIVGYRHHMPRLIMAFASIVSSVVLAFLAFEVMRLPVERETTFGIGFWVVLAGAIGMSVAALSERPDSLD